MLEGILHYLILYAFSVIAVAVYFGSRMLLGMHMDYLDDLLDSNKPYWRRIMPFFLMTLFGFLILVLYPIIKNLL